MAFCRSIHMLVGMCAKRTDAGASLLSPVGLQGDRRKLEVTKANSSLRRLLQGGLLGYDTLACTLHIDSPKDRICALDSPRNDSWILTGCTTTSAELAKGGRAELQLPSAAFIQLRKAHMGMPGHPAIQI